MKIEYYSFYNSYTRKRWFIPQAKPTTPVSTIKEELPSSILSQLLDIPTGVNPITINIETKNAEAIQYVADILRKRGFDFDKAKHIETTKDEIDNYEFFFVGLQSLHWGEQFDYDVTRPTCKFEACPIGAKITSSVYLKTKYAGTFLIGKCDDMWNMNTRFILSQKIKEVFESEGITGLKYEQCLIGHRDEKGRWTQESYEDKYYLAEIISTVHEEADDIYLDKRDFCKTHSILFRYDGLINRRKPYWVISHDDFQMINRVKVKGKEYYYRISMYFVSRKVLKILLAQAPSDISYPMCIYYKDGLTPVSFD